MSGIEIPWLDYSLMGLAAILLVIPTWPWIRLVRFHIPLTITKGSTGRLPLGTDPGGFLGRITRKRPSDEQIREDQRLAAVLRSTMEHDWENIRRCYWIRQDTIDWSHLHASTGSAYIEFAFLLTSARVWIATLTNKVDGLLKYRFDNAHQQGDIHQDPQVTLSDQLKSLGRTFSGVFWVRQYLPTEVLADLNAHPSDGVTFLFSDVKIAIQLRSPIDDQEEERFIELPSGWQATIPIFEARHQ